ncbi:MAG TPA: radical SAM protein [Chitinophagales bacterium]|nr:radical SAM protein [Chitinophagales bacterium]HMY43675.1 radical SAM protein [Chitinophagales bacterium]HNM67958.1 radical SAM protein [Chitinophagales bacterium]
MKNIREFIIKNKVLSSIAIKAYNQYNQLKVNRADFKYNEAKNPSITKNELLNYNRNRNFKVSKVLCFAPKSSMIFSFDGNVYLCCENKSYPIGNILKQSISEIWFGEQRQFLDNEINNNYNLSHGCQSCEWKIKNDVHSLALAQSFDLYSSQSNSNYPARLDFEIHNTCNLECVMCRGIYSSSIQANRNKESARKILYDDTFIEQLKEFIPHLRYVNLLGGEPTLIKIYYEIMENVISLNPECLIHLQTNASKINDRFKNYLSRGNFQIGISIDSLNKEKVETIRKNIVFNEFMQNVNYYVQLYLSNKIKLTVNTCPMPENWSDVLDIIDFCNNNRISISFSIVKYPYYSSFESSNIEFINQVVKVYREKLQTMPRKGYFERNNYNRLKDLIQQTEKLINK